MHFFYLIENKNTYFSIIFYVKIYLHMRRVKLQTPYAREFYQTNEQYMIFL